MPTIDMPNSWASVANRVGRSCFLFSFTLKEVAVLPVTNSGFIFNPEAVPANKTPYWSVSFTVMPYFSAAFIVFSYVFLSIFPVAYNGEFFSPFSSSPSVSPNSYTNRTGPKGYRMTIGMAPGMACRPTDNHFLRLATAEAPGRCTRTSMAL